MTKIIGIQGVAGSGKTTLTQALGKAPSTTTLFWNGDLGGYGGGIKRKEWLLKHERK